MNVDDLMIEMPREILAENAHEPCEDYQVDTAAFDFLGEPLLETLLASAAFFS